MMIAQTSQQIITIKCDSFPKEFFCHVVLYASAFAVAVAARCFPVQMHKFANWNGPMTISFQFEYE